LAILGVINEKGIHDVLIFPNLGGSMIFATQKAPQKSGRPSLLLLEVVFLVCGGVAGKGLHLSLVIPFPWESQVTVDTLW
jgi:hypothetical protein